MRIASEQQSFEDDCSEPPGWAAFCAPVQITYIGAYRSLPYCKCKDWRTRDPTIQIRFVQT
jgi:hypothetical protein